MATGSDIHKIINATTCVGTLLDELTLLRVALRLYADGMTAEDAIAKACEMLSDSLSKIPSQ
jgi:hypothetical protein